MTGNSTTGDSPPRLLIIMAFAAIYLLWGSAYLATRFAVQTITPFVMTSIRSLAAGGILFVWARLRGAPRPTRANWLASLVVGSMLFVGGMGASAWALQFVPSGLAAVLIGTSPLWMVVLDWLWLGAERPTRMVVLGLLLGIAGIVLFVGPESLTTISDGQSAGTKRTLGMAVLLSSAVSWSAGSIYSRRARLPDMPFLAAGMQMLMGGMILLIIAGVTGEFGRFHLARITSRSLLSLGYLIVFGAIVGFSAYFWLLQVSTPARVATFAYVNPVVALLLGWGLGDEPLTERTLVACAVIVVGVALITNARVRSGGPQSERQQVARQSTTT